MGLTLFMLPVVISAGAIEPAAAPAPLPVNAQEVLVGKVRPTDGDSLRMGDKRIRLYGIDAVESAQTCDLNGEPWKCGRASKAALERLTKGKTVTCEVRDMDRDRYVSVCRSAGVDINDQMVRRGWAVAYTRYALDYVPAELDARERTLGLWREEVSFERPHDYRARLRAERAAAHVPQAIPASGCALKGNISRSGNKIFHSPGQRDYERTSINERDGERWFCSADEAVAAGWRAAKR